MTDNDKKKIPQVLEIAKGYLLIDDTSKDAVLTSVISSAAELIRNYCNFYDTESIPDGLVYTWAEMAMAKYKHTINQFQSGDGSSSGKGKDVASVSDGSQSVSYDNTGASDFAGMAESDKEFVNGFAYSLNRYRRLRWD